MTQRVASNFCACLTSFFVIFLSAPAPAADRVILQLRWDHEFQFAGYYAAKWKGFFAEEGLDVDIRSGVTADRKFVSAPDEVLKGSAQFGVGAADLIPLIDKGHDFVIVNSFMQESGNALYALAGTPLKHPSDLTKLRVARKVDDMVDSELRILLNREGIDEAAVRPYPYKFGIGPLLDGTVDVIPGRSLSIPWLAMQAGVRLNRLRPVDYGINFYGDTLFTHGSIVKSDPDLVARFSRASIRGWRYALENVDEIARRISTDLPRSFPLKNPLAYNLFEASQVAALALYPFVDIGHTNPHRWERMYELSARAGLIAGGRDIGALIFNPVVIEQEKKERIVIWIAVIVGGALIILFAYYVFSLNRQRRLLLTANRQLQETRSQLQQSQKLEVVGQLAGGIAHDFNNILGIIVGNLDLAGLEIAAESNASRHLEAAKGGVRRAALITEKLLDFSRLSTGDAQIVPVNELIKGMGGLVARSLTAAIEVETHLSEDLWPVLIDDTEFENVLLNLSLNARDAMPGGGKLVIETSNKILDEAHVSLNPMAHAGEFVMIAVSDTGVGMTPEVREKALEPFFSTKEQGKGTGLGLSMIYGFVQRSGGHMKIYSEPGEGTTVRLYLPRAHGDAAFYTPTHRVTEAPSRGDETILVVDDEKDLVDIAVGYLGRLGYKCLTASDGRDALAVLDSEPGIDLAFIDVIMPGGMDGYELALAIHKAHPSIRILVTSGFSRIREVYVNGERDFVAGLAANLLSKPYNLAELAVAVRRNLDVDSQT